MSIASKQTLRLEHFDVSFPAPKILLVTINRPSKLNCINRSTSLAIAEIWEQFDADASLWVGIITGTGRAFCTGADLIEWNQMIAANTPNPMTAPGLCGLPRRSGKKPIIAAVNGLCLGGGFEMIANCDLVVASATASFALPEGSRGIVPVAGCLPRLARTLGLQRTMDLVLTGRRISASELERWGVVNRIVGVGLGEGQAAQEVANGHVVLAALGLAQEMCAHSPDALIIGRKGVRQAWEMASVEAAVTGLEREWYPKLMAGPNFAEGVRAFVEKRRTRWVDSKL